MVTLKSPKPRYSWLSGVPFCLCDLGPLLGGSEAEERSSKSRKCLPSAEGFLFAALGPRGCAPWNPGRGCPLHRTPYKRLRRHCPGPLAEGRGAGGRAPPTPCRQAWVAPVASRAVSSPLRAASRTNPLTRPPLEKRATGPHRGLEGHCRSGWGSRLAQRPRSSGLDAQERPQRSGLVAGVLFPSRLPVANAPGGPPESALTFDFCF